MLFNSHIFILVFLPVTLLGFFLLGGRGQVRAARDGHRPIEHRGERAIDVAQTST